MLDKDQVTNISTALMAIKDLATSCKIPINIHFADEHIYVHVGFGTPYRKEMSFYPQDTYRLHSETDDIYKWIEETAENINAYKTNPSLHPNQNKNGKILRGLRTNGVTIQFDGENFSEEVKTAIENEVAKNMKIGL